MLEKTLKEFMEDSEKLIAGAIVNDDFLKIKTDNGNAVLISEDEWNILLGAFKMAIDGDSKKI